MFEAQQMARAVQKADRQEYKEQVAGLLPGQILYLLVRYVETLEARVEALENAQTAPSEPTKAVRKTA